VCNERFQIDQAGRDKADGLWVRIMVTILKSKVDLFGGEVHEWDIRKIFTTADNEYHVTESARLERPKIAQSVSNSVNNEPNLNDSVSDTHVDTGLYT